MDWKLLISWKWSWPNLRYHFGYFLVRLQKDAKYHSQDNKSSGKDSNLQLPNKSTNVNASAHCSDDICYQIVMPCRFLLRFNRVMVNNQG
jgi:hypothetical protein